MWLASRARDKPAMLLGMGELLAMLVADGVRLRSARAAHAPLTRQIIKVAFPSADDLREFLWDLLVITGAFQAPKETQTVLAKLAQSLSRPRDALRVVPMLDATPTPLRRQDKGWAYEVDMLVGTGGGLKLKAARVGLNNRGCVPRNARARADASASKVNVLRELGHSGPSSSRVR